MLRETGIGLEFPHELYSTSGTMEKLIRHHETLYNQGRVKAVVTCLRSAHLALAEKGIPAHHVLSTRFAIERAFSDVIQTFEMLHFRDSQIAVQLIEFTEPELTPAADEELKATADEEPKASGPADQLTADETQQSTAQEPLLKTHMTGAIEAYTHKLQGSIRWTSDSEGMILTTRGALAEVTDGFRKKPPVQETMQYKDLWRSLDCGIGIGRTVFEAQENAAMAIQHAQKYAKGRWVVVFDNKKIKELSDDVERGEQNLSYDYADERLQQAAEIAGLSVSTLSKVTHVMHRLGTDELTANELAQNMHILPRSARRILGALERSGFAQVKGEEAPFLQGRPRKLYQVTLKE